MPQFAVIILAAGLSSRMGQSKPLLPWLHEKSVVQTVIETYDSVGIAPIFVITGHRHEAVEQHLAGMNVTCIYNPDYATGEILSSLKVGLQALPDETDAVFITPVDLPRIPVDIINMVKAAYQPGHIVAPFYDKQRGHPILLDKSFWQAMLDLPEDAAPRDVIRAHKDKMLRVEVQTDSVITDMDTPELYEQELAKARVLQDATQDAGIVVMNSFDEAFALKKQRDEERTARIEQRKRTKADDEDSDLK